MSDKSIAEQMWDFHQALPTQEIDELMMEEVSNLADKVEAVEREARHTKRILAYLYIHADLAPHHRGMVNEALGYPSFDEMEELSQ